MALIVPMAKRPNSLFCASTMLDFVRLSFVRLGAVLPPYKKLALLTKNRSVSLHFQKPMQRVGLFTFKNLCSVWVICCCLTISLLIVLIHTQEVLMLLNPHEQRRILHHNRPSLAYSPSLQ